MDSGELNSSLKEIYGISIKSTERKSVNKRWFVKLNEDTIAKSGGYLEKLPYILKIAQEEKYYAEAYLVSFDKGLGTLQKSAKNPGFFRANIVGVKGNNDVVGQAELFKLDPSDAMQLSQAILSVYTVASVLTNQYFMARINQRLAGIEEATGKIIRILVNDKKMKQLADNSFLTERMKNLEFIEQNDVYRQATLANIQTIRINAESNIRFYRQELYEQINSASVSDKKEETEKMMGEYSSSLPQYWFAVFIYGFAAYLEAKLSGVTDAEYLDSVEMDILGKVNDYRLDIEKLREAIREYFANVKHLRGFRKAENAVVHYGPIAGMVIGGLAGESIVVIASKLLKKYNGDKDKAREEFEKRIDELFFPYMDFNALTSSASGVSLLNNIYNQPVQILVEDGEVYMKAKSLKQKAQVKSKN